MDVGRAFGFLFQDQRWVAKILLAAVMLVIPIFGWLVLFGYAMRITRQVAAGTDLPLPEWEDWGGLFVEGLRAFGVYFVWGLPGNLLYGIGQFGADRDQASGGLLLFSCLGFVVAVVTGFVVPAALARTAVTSSFGAGLEVGAIFALVRDNLGDYFILLLLGVVAGIIASLGFIALCVGVLVTIPYAYFMLAHLYGQVYYRANRGMLAPTAGPRF